MSADSDIARKLQDARYAIDQALKHLLTVSTVMANLKQCEISNYQDMAPMVTSAYIVWMSSIATLQGLTREAFGENG